MIQDFINYLKYEKRVSMHTLSSYERDIKNYLDNCSINSKEEALKWLKSLKTQHKPNTIKRKLSAVNAYYKYLNMPFPLVDIKIKQGLRVPYFATEANMLKILDDYNYPNTFIGQRNRLIIYLIYFIGLRASEITVINIYDINSGFIKINGKGNKQRVVPIPSPLQLTIDNYLEYRETLNCNNNFLILTSKGKQTTRVLIGKIVKNILSFSTNLKKCSPHVLRHTFATSLINNGASILAIKEILGHQSIETTQIYTHTCIDGLKKSYKAHPRQ